jgi:hypothetical protein
MKRRRGRAEAAAEVFRESVRWDPGGSHVKYMYLGQVMGREGMEDRMHR